MQGRNIIIFAVLAIALAIVFLLQLVFGSVNIPFSEVLSILQGNSNNEAWSNIVIEARLPGALAALLAGAGLSVSGLQMQTMFRNPVAGPYVLGISAGASLGVAILIMASTAIGITNEVRLMSSWSIILAAALGAVLIFLVNFAISFRLNDVVAILIIGLMIGGGISALIEIICIVDLRQFPLHQPIADRIFGWCYSCGACVFLCFIEATKPTATWRYVCYHIGLKCTTRQNDDSALHQYIGR